MVRRMVLEFLQTLGVIFMKEIGKTISSMVREFYYIIIRTNMKEIGKIISGTVKVKLSMLMEIFMMVNGLMIKKKVMEN